MRANPEIDALLTELLDSGVSPKYVSRIAAELEDHYADLEEEALRFGVPDGDAALDAKRRLGHCSAIAKEFELRPELKSWAYSRWLERVLRLLGTAYLLVRAPARVVAAGQPAVLRYTAATAAGASVTVAILLLLTAMMSPDSNWGVRLVEHAGAALGAWELERPRRRPVREPRPSAEPAARPPGERRGSMRDADEPGSLTVSPERARQQGAAGDISASAALDPFERRAVARRTPVIQPVVLALPDELSVAAGPFFDSSKARVVLSDIEPSIYLDDSELRPIVKVVPDYPLVAARRGVEGHVVIEYTVTRTGAVEDPVVVDSSNPVFNRAALDATRHFKYRPRLIRGEAVDVRGVRLVIRFELEA